MQCMCSETLHGSYGASQCFHLFLVRYAYTCNRFYATGRVQLLHFLCAELGEGSGGREQLKECAM